MVEIEGSNYFTVEETAKIICVKDDKGKQIGRNKFFNLLRFDGVLLYNNFPAQYYIDLDLVRMYAVSRSGKTYYIPVISQKGIGYLQNKYKDYTFITKKPTFVKHFVDLNEIC